MAPTPKMKVHNKISPYASTVITRAKARNLKTLGKVEELLNHNQTPPYEELVDSFCELVDEVLDREDRKEKDRKERDRKEQDRKEESPKAKAFHLMGDILFKSTTPIRSRIQQEAKMRTSDFIYQWHLDGIDNDNTTQGQLLMKIVKKQFPKKGEAYCKNEYNKYKVWLQMYAARCNLVHGGLDDMSSQDAWNHLKAIEKQLKSGEADFENPTWNQYGILAIEEVRTFKFSKDSKGKYHDRQGNNIVV